MKRQWSGRRAAVERQWNGSVERPWQNQVGQCGAIANGLSTRAESSSLSDLWRGGPGWLPPPGRSRCTAASPAGLENTRSLQRVC